MNVARVSLLACVLVVTSIDAYAYIGPGAAVSAIGSFLALIAGFFLAIVGFIWMPIRRRLRQRKQELKEKEALPPAVDSVE